MKIHNKFLCTLIAFNWIVALQEINGEEDDPVSLQLAAWSYNHPGIERATDTDGSPYPSLTSTLSIGINGPGLLEDHFLLERITHFNRERIPERVVHAKGTAAYGTFTVTHDISRWTKAKFLNQINKLTPVFLRFSGTLAENGYPDTIPDPKGFAVKFYTEDGNFDIVGNQFEVFNVRDPMQFSDSNRSKKRNPQTNLRDFTMIWDFNARRPETIHHTLKLFSDISYPENLRMINGSGVHTFKLVNAVGEAFYCKFHFISKQEFKMMSHEKSALLAGSEPNYYQKDLYNSILTGKFPRWILAVQLATVSEAEKYTWDAFDITKNWRFEDFPLYEVGILELNAMPSDFFAHTEQAAFNPGNLVPGIETPPDRMFHARAFSYPDAQRYRVGVNRNMLPVNRPIDKVSTYERNGQMCFGSNGAGAPNYHPNSFKGPEIDIYAAQLPFYSAGEVRRVDTFNNDNYSQAQLFLRDISFEERQRIANGIGASLALVTSKEVRDLAFETNIRPLKDEDFEFMVQTAMEYHLIHPWSPIPERS